MLVAYLTVDEVNQDMAVRLASRCNVTVHPVSFRELPLKKMFDALVYDLDSFPDSEREEILTKLLNSLALYPVAVHSYCLAGRQAQRLRQNGVVVRRRLTEATFLGLKPGRAEVGRLLSAGA